MSAQNEILRVVRELIVMVQEARYLIDNQMNENSRKSFDDAEGRALKLLKKLSQPQSLGSPKE
jgi:hypothetical protein